jgi:hypothetical protein
VPGDSISDELTPTGKTYFFSTTDTISVNDYTYDTETQTYGDYRKVEFEVLSMKPKAKK